MKLLVSALITTVTVTAIAIAQNESAVENSPVPIPENSNLRLKQGLGVNYRHNANRAIAFATAQLLAEGTDIHEWKAVEAYNYCYLPSYSPSALPNSMQSSSPSEGPTANPSGSASPFPTGIPTLAPSPCSWDVYVTTAYEFIECENGLAYIQRSGYGRTVNSIDEGTTFGWSESSGCESLSGLDQAARRNLNSPNRSLDFDRIQIDRR